MISKTQVVEHFGSVAKVAEFFNIAPQAVYQWPDDSIPRERELELMVRLPDVFAPSGTPNARPHDSHAPAR